MTSIRVIQEDITTLKVDAIVNAANKSLLGGGGVDGAIHKAAGPELLEACKKNGPIDVGDAAITWGADLNATFVIHAVGPQWQGGETGEADKLRSAYHRSLELARLHDVKTLAFPNISTGVYGYPKEEAADIAIEAVQDYTDGYPQVFDEIIFVCYNDDNFKIYKEKL